MRSELRRSACWTVSAARAAVLASAAPADTTHNDQLLSVWPSVTRFIAMLTTLEQPGCVRISFNALHCKSSIESRDFAIRGFTSKRFRSCAPNDRSHDRDGADSVTFRSD